jgi:pimeloyl-ACP methyl ester carboxylesterase
MAIRKPILRLLTTMLITLLSTVIVVVLLLLIFQDRLIWFPRRYDANVLAHLPAGTTALPYRTPAGDQVAFVHAPSAPGVDPKIAPVWVFCYGNGSLALEWPEQLMPPDATVLLIEYPGYGASDGAPSPAANDASIDAALDALGQRLGHPVTPTGMLGHSMGCAFVLRTALRHPPRKLVLIAPYTSLRAMARRTVGWPLCWLLRHNLDNQAALDALCAGPHPPTIDILQDRDDEVIPVAMGRALAAAHPQQVRWHEVTGSGHNEILDYHLEDIAAAMTSATAASPDDSAAANRLAHANAP